MKLFTKATEAKKRAVRSLQSVSTVEELRQALLSPSFQPEKTALIEEAIDGIPTGPTDDVKISDISIQNGAIQGTVEQTSESLVVFSESSYPGWRASIDEAPSPVYSVNANQMAVRVPAGTHEVHLTFRSSSHWYGLLGSGISHLLLVAIGISFFFRQLTNTSSKESVKTS